MRWWWEKRFLIKIITCASHMLAMLSSKSDSEKV